MKLDEIARNMKKQAELEPNKPVRTTLGKGLKLAFGVMPDTNTCRLVATREGVYPSDAEIKVLRSCFLLSDDAGQSQASKWIRNIQAMSVVIEWTWQKTLV